MGFRVGKGKVWAVNLFGQATCGSSRQTPSATPAATNRARSAPPPPPPWPRACSSSAAPPGREPWADQAGGVHPPPLPPTAPTTTPSIIGEEETSTGAPLRVHRLPAAADPAIVAYEEFVAEAVERLTVAAEKMGGKVLDATKLVAKAFAVTKDLLVKAKQLQVIEIDLLS
ncbi:fidgetin-like protein 2 isoform X2 [Panicum virgatum]|uniref:fidgetin-like protein 2 isoform X2 n=1 Tax=Panicum virgatum TaxID=38727 RepID=UPI0019D5542E|nr:fidgetin-like protein 2 isoform X2 [Panicum virgatum]